MIEQTCEELKQEIAEIENDPQFKQLCKQVRELEINALKKMFDEEDENNDD